VVAVSFALGLGDATETWKVLGGPGGPSTVFGRTEGARATDAALVNGALCHALDFDDTHAGAIAHISTVLVPATIATAEELGASGADLLAALVIGNEVAIRVGLGASGGFHRRGFHPTSVCGVFGAAAAAARLRGLDVGATTRALGICGSYAGGIFEYLADGSATKPLHAGWAAHGGILAAALAEAGAEGPATVLEGRFGVYNTFNDDEPTIEAAFGNLGEIWETPAITYKPYSACHYVHAPVDAALQASGGRPIAAAEIEAVRLRVPEGAVSLTLEPYDRKQRPASVYEAKFSMPFAVGAALTRGGVEISTFTAENLSDPEILAVADRTSYEVVDFPTWPGAFPGQVTVELGSGETLEAELPYERGHAKNPLADEEIIGKFRGTAGLGLDAEEVDALERAVLTLEDIADPAAALSPLRAASHPSTDPTEVPR
jgi:2-methylcitrate dehydratase PrpD